MKSKLKALFLLISLSIVSIHCSDDSIVQTTQTISKEQLGKMIFF